MHNYRKVRRMNSNINSVRFKNTSKKQKAINEYGEKIKIHSGISNNFEFQKNLFKGGENHRETKFCGLGLEWKEKISTSGNECLSRSLIKMQTMSEKNL